jgi:hypothetical protein
MDKTFLVATLERLYAEGQNNRDKVTTIQSWCITVWLPALTVGTSPGLDFGAERRLALPFLAIATFWLLAAFQLTFSELDDERALRLERILLKGSLDTPSNHDVGCF